MKVPSESGLGSSANSAAKERPMKVLQEAIKVVEGLCIDVSLERFV